LHARHRPRTNVSHAEFLHLIPRLSQQFHVYLLDLRGHGRSAWTKRGYLIADYAHDLAVVLQHIVGRPAILLGHSLGGAWRSGWRPTRPTCLKLSSWRILVSTCSNASVSAATRCSLISRSCVKPCHGIMPPAPTSNN
jgi:predicted alpha/beta-fold hydrolase